MQSPLNDWNDLRLVLAIADGGGLAAAAQAMSLDRSTVFRRLAALETRLGVRLFERLPSGLYIATAAGRRMAEAAERMADEAAGLEREITGMDRRLSGRLRVTASETLAYRLLVGIFAAFRRSHPGIVIELIVDNRVLSLSRREADVALRATRPLEGDLWGRKLADVAWTVYGARSYLATHGAPSAPADMAGHALIGWDDVASGINAASWLGGVVPDQALVYRSSSLLNQLAAAKAGIGLAALPCYLGDKEPDLGRALAEPVPALARELWIVTHADLRRTARVAALFEAVVQGIDSVRDLIGGHAPSAAA